MSDPDTMYFHQAMKDNDAAQILESVHKEFLDFLSKRIFELIPHSIVPEGETILPTVRAMKPRQKLQTMETLEYKARINLDGYKIHPGVQYNQTYAPVLSWGSIITLLFTLLNNNWKTMQLECVLDFPQAPVGM